ncbi:phosphodiester glycosidase family protein [Streptomyces sp. NPDC001941]|uniref:phosphodiester glycosidase family protein n=1 Tax=Streptomyces sp. NPDC001941 TaxID=3154659 RepID=UPI00331F4C1A
MLTTAPRRARRPYVLTTATLLLASLTAGPASADDPASSLITQPGFTATTTAYAPGITHVRYENPGDERVVDVLRVDPDTAPLTLESTTGTGFALPERTTDQLASTTTVAARRPHAGVNGGFFALDADKSTLTTMGVSVQEGVVQALSCAAPSQAEAVVLQHGRPYVTQVTTHATVTSATGKTWDLDGVNRHPGWVPRCPQGPGDVRTSVPGIYTDASEIVSFTPQYGSTTPRPGDKADITADDDPGAEAVVGPGGTVTALDPQGRGGTRVPAGGTVLQGVGDGAAWLRANATVGTALRVDTEARDERFGDDIALDASVDIVNGHYELVRNAAYAYTGNNTDSAPRTAIGADGAARTLLVTVSGRTTRAGVTLDELARVMQDLGAVDALNLDGGGSTTMVLGQRIVNRPSDATGERAVADSVYAGFGGYGLLAQ